MCQSAFAQQVISKHTKPDSLYVVMVQDEMDGTITYYPSMRILATDDGEKGFALSAFLNRSMNVEDLEVLSAGLGCSEHDEVIILFDNGEKITKKSWNEFNCKGNSWFHLSSSDKELLSKQPIKKVRFTSGRSYESYTQEIQGSDKTYFIRLFNMCQERKYFIVK